MVRKKGFWIGKLYVMLELADDGKWDWESANGDKHMDFLSVALIDRPDRHDQPVKETRVLKLSLGPFMLLAARKQL